MRSEHTSGPRNEREPEEIALDVEETPVRRSEKKQKGVRKSAGADRLPDLARDILRAYSAEPRTKQAAIEAGVAGRTSIFGFTKVLEDGGYIELGDDGNYRATPKGKEFLRGADTPPERGPAPESSGPRGGSKEDKAARSMVVKQKAKREVIRTEVEQVKLDALRAKRPSDLDEDLKAERLRKVRLANDRAENAERERERKRALRSTRESERAKADPKSEVVRSIQIMKRDPIDDGGFVLWVTLDAIAVGSAGDEDAESVLALVEGYVFKFGDHRCEHVGSVFNSAGRLLGESTVYEPRESKVDQELRRTNRLLARARKQRAELGLPPTKEHRPRFAKSSMNWRMPWQR